MTRRQVIAWTLLIPVGPIVVAWAFLATLFREGGRACWFAWNEARIEISAIRRALAGIDVTGDDE